MGKTSLISEVLTDCDVSDKISQMDVLRKKNLYGIFVELSNLHWLDQFFNVNL